MIDLDYTIFVQFANFVITLFVLNFLLVAPIREIIKKRKDTMGGMVSATEKFTADAETKLANYNKALDAARIEGSETRSALKATGVAEEKGILSAAGQQASEALKAERMAVESEVNSAMAGLKGQVNALADKVVAKVLG